ncbi:MAG: hypothetical protein ACUVQ8_04830, partial [Nitrososphaeria archaeon]
MEKRYIWLCLDIWLAIVEYDKHIFQKKNFFELLDRDVEFTYAVAGYLGLSEILKRLDKLEENQVKLWENLNRLW